MSESRNEAMAAGYAAGYVLFPLLLLALGVILGFAMAKKSEGKKFNFLPFGICWGLVFLGLIGQLGNKGSQLAAAQASEMQVQRVAGQPAADLPATLSPEVVKTFGDSMAKRTFDNARVLGWTQAAPPPGTHWQSAVRIGDKTVIRVDTELQDFATVVQFAGVVDGKEANVICWTKRPTVFVYEGSKCETEVAAMYGAIPTRAGPK